MGVLNLFTFKTPTLWAVMSKRGDTDCALYSRSFEMCNGANLHWYKPSQVSKYFLVKLYKDK
jgi:hypothetical protein